MERWEREMYVEMLKKESEEIEQEMEEAKKEGRKNNKARQPNY